MHCSVLVDRFTTVEIRTELSRAEPNETLNISVNNKATTV